MKTPIHSNHYANILEKLFLHFHQSESDKNLSVTFHWVKKNCANRDIAQKTRQDIGELVDRPG